MKGNFELELRIGELCALKWSDIKWQNEPYLFSEWKIVLDKLLTMLSQMPRQVIGN